MKNIILSAALFIVSGTSFAIPCELQVAALCPDGYVDGCFLKDNANRHLTFEHIFVPLNETQDVACELQVGRVCGEGEKDACLFRPAASKYHICVLDN